MLSGGVIRGSSLFLIVLISISAASIVPDTPNERISHHRYTRGAACRLPDGRNIPDGQNFTRTDTGPCVSYQCSDGNVLPLEYKCFRDGKCYPLNDMYKLGCIERTCQLSGGRFDYIVTKEACTGRDINTCIDVGTTYNEGCFQYTCDKVQETSFSVSYHLRQTSSGCELSGQCIALNQTVTQGCRTLQCQKRFTSVGFSTIKTGCEINGQCVDVNGKMEQDCRTFTCSESNLNGVNVLNLRPTKIRCKDADGACNEPGDWFPLLMDDKVRVNCTCAVVGLSVQLSCPSVGIGVGVPPGK